MRCGVHPMPQPTPAKVIMFSKPPADDDRSYNEGVIVEASPSESELNEPAESIREALIRALPMPEHWIIETEAEGVPVSPALLALVDLAIDRRETWDLIRAERGDLLDGAIVETLLVGRDGWQVCGERAVHGE